VSVDFTSPDLAFDFRLPELGVDFLLGNLKWLHPFLYPNPFESALVHGNFDHRNACVVHKPIQG